MTTRETYHPMPINVSANNTQLSINISGCMFYDAASGQCYVSEQHLKDEIWAFLQPTVTEWTFLALYLLCFLLGLGGNGLVVWAVVRNAHLRSTTNVLLTNLALADFLAVLVCMPPSFVQTIWETWFLGRTLCKMVEYYQLIVVLVSILTLTAISVERYCAICRPLTFKETRRRVVVCLVLIWVAAHLAALPRLFIMDLHHDEMVPPEVTIMLTSCVPSESMNTMALRFEMFLCVVFYGLPILVMGFAYTAVAFCLWASSSVLMETDSSAIMTQLKARRRIALMLIVVVVAFIVCSLPVYVWNMVRLIFPASISRIDPEMGSGISLGAQLLPMINSCVNPIIYNFMSVKFRKEFHAACCCEPCFMKSAANAGNSYGHEMSRLKYKTKNRMYDNDSTALKTTVTEA